MNPELEEALKEYDAEHKRHFLDGFGEMLYSSDPADIEDYDISRKIDDMLKSMPSRMEIDKDGDSIIVRGVPHPGSTTLIDRIIDDGEDSPRFFTGSTIASGGLSSALGVDSTVVGRVCCGDKSVGLEVDDYDGSPMNFNADDIREIQKMAQRWGVLGENRMVVDPEAFAGIPAAIINATVEAIKTAIDTADCGKSPSLEVVAMKTAILEIVEKFAR